MDKFLNKNRLVVFLGLFIFGLLFYRIVYAALSCTVTDTCTEPAVVVFEMQATSNSHAGQTSSSYTNLVCCTVGDTSLGTSCSGEYEVVARLSGTTNAHIEENDQATAAYDGNDVCLSATVGTVTVGYQNGNCDTFDDIVASISPATTNAHVGTDVTYARKICAKVVTATGVFDITASSSESFNSGAALSFSFNSQTTTVAKASAIQIEDDRGTNAGWDVYLGATDWKSGKDVMQLDYNGTGTDNNLGKFCAFPAEAAISAETGSITGVSVGSANACFSAGITSIAVASATATNGNGKYWLTDMKLEQFIPFSPTAQVYTTTIYYTLISK